jgi:hypothetical protein
MIDAFIPFAALLAGGPAQACPADPDPAATILQLHENARRAHLQSDVSIMADGWAQEVVSSSRGELSVNRKEAIVEMFDKYLRQVRYSEWRDVEPPLVRVSPDGKVAWMAVRLVATLTPTADPAKVESFKSSWVATYERRDCRWRMTAIASSVLPDPPKAAPAR